MTAIAWPQNNSQDRGLLFAGRLCGLDSCLRYRRSAKPPPGGTSDRVEPFRGRGQGRRLYPKTLGIDPFNLDLDRLAIATVGQRLGDGFIGVLKLGYTCRRWRTLTSPSEVVARGSETIAPDRQFQAWCGGDIEGIQHA